MQRQIQPQLVVSDRAITSSEEASAIIQILSKTAVELNYTRIVAQLGQAEAAGSSKPDALDNLPDITPVKRPAKNKKVRFLYFPSFDKTLTCCVGKGRCCEGR